MFDFLLRALHIGVIASALLLCACGGDDALPPAPPGERAVLEQLAESYEQVSDQLPTRPSSLTPDARHKFVTEVFRKAGYDYSRTLIALGESYQPADVLHRDLMELVFLPVNGLPPGGLGELYSDEEIVAIGKIKAARP
jgi:hypothetical protein